MGVGSVRASAFYDSSRETGNGGNNERGDFLSDGQNKLITVGKVSARPQQTVEMLHVLNMYGF